MTITPIHTGPCEPWVTPQEITDCCGHELGTNSNLEDAAEQASDLLYRLSGHRYPGLCDTTVRPCTNRGSCWHHRHDWHASRDCSCRRLSRIRLAGYPIREILEVTIDGATVDPADYRLDYNRDLVRLNGGRWPACQRLDIDSGAGTFFVSYVYGLEPPLSGVTAAAQLACAIVKACPDSETAGECDLPEGTVRVTRLGITVDTQALGLWLLGTIRTGMPLVDAFLSVYGAPRQRRTALAVPELDPWPLRVAT